jgi:uncharacterized membrane protein YbjE (DUF340 family)
MMRANGATLLRFVALVLVGVAVGFLVRSLLPLVLERGVVFLAVLILFVAVLLSLRAVRRTRRGS